MPKYLAGPALRGQATINNDRRYRERTNTVAHVLLDLMHYAALYDVDFERELANARTAFLHDTSPAPNAPEGEPT